LLKALKREGVDPKHCEAKLFGGGNMLPSLHRQNVDGSAVGLRNIEIARTRLTRHGIPLVAENCGGFGHRTVLFEVWSGHVWVRHTGSTEPRQPLQQKKQPEETNVAHRTKSELTIKGT
jgi:chemotaxis protein CheD